MARLTPNPIESSLFGEEDDFRVGPQRVVNAPSLRRAHYVFTHDVMICKEAQKSELSYSAKCEEVGFERFDPPPCRRMMNMLI